MGGGGINVVKKMGPAAVIILLSAGDSKNKKPKERNKITPAKMQELISAASILFLVLLFLFSYGPKPKTRNRKIKYKRSGRKIK